MAGGSSCEITPFMSAGHLAWGPSPSRFLQYQVRGTSLSCCSGEVIEICVERRPLEVFFILSVYSTLHQEGLIPDWVLSQLP